VVIVWVNRKDMTISFDLDPSCAVCQKGLLKLQKLQAASNVYGTRSLKTGKIVGKVKMIPDFNSAGILTHWHIA